MKQHSKRDTTAINHQSGIALVLFAALAPILIGLVALAADLGSLYLARDRLNSLARTGAAAGMNLRALKGWANLACATDNYSTDMAGSLNIGIKASTCSETTTPTAATQLVLDAMKAAVVESISKFYPDQDSATYLWFKSGDQTYWSHDITKHALNLYSPDEKIRLQVRYYPKTLLASKLTSIFGSNLCVHPSTGNTAEDQNRCEVLSDATNSSGSLRPANVYLLLDTSGSMARVEAGQTKSKMDALKEAVGSFIDSFNPQRDKIALIPFSTGAPQTVSAPSNFATKTASGDRLQIKQDVLGYGPNGQTNPCDALLRTIQAIPTPAPGTAAAASFAVFFTDGAPNVYRLGFCDSTQGCLSRPQTAGMSPISTANDWYGWTVKWGQRQTVAIPTPSAAANINPDADPVFGLPRILDRNGNPVPQTTPSWTSNGTTITINTLGNPVMDQTGRFRYQLSSGSWYTLNNVPSNVTPSGGLRLAFKNLSVAEDNYLWNGPSYLVNASYPIRNENSLIDRIQNGIGVTSCGPPNNTIADQFNYNHSRYFASRVVNANWNLSDSKMLTTLLTSNTARFPGQTPLNLNYLFFPPPFSATTLDTSPQSTPVTPLVGYTNYPLPANPGCLNTLNSFLPGTTGPAQIYVNGTGAPNPFLSNADSNLSSIQTVGEIVKTAELPYYCAIRAADYLREKGIILFVIGLGPAASDRYSTSCNDPMQNALDFDSRKDNFLRRLAFAPEALMDPAAFIANPTAGQWSDAHDFRFKQRTLSSCTNSDPNFNHPLNGQNVWMGYSEGSIGTVAPETIAGAQPGGAPGVANSDQFGAYYGSNDPSQLTPLFGKIAKQILLRLST